VPETGIARLSPDTEARWIPFELTPGNQILFKAEIDGKTVSALLDTGASNSVISRTYAARARLKVTPRGKVVAVGGDVPLGWANTTLVSFGGLARSGGGINVVDLPARLTGIGGIDMLAGRDLLQAFALEIDFAGRRFRLLRSGRLPFTGTQAPLSIGRAPLAYVTRITIGRQRLEPLIIDTGDGTTLTLSGKAWRSLPLAPAPARTTALAYGVGGAVEFEIATIPELAIGDQVIRDVETGIEATGGFSDSSQSAGRIGMGLLQRFRILLDPSAGHMVLADSKVSVAPPPRSTSGLQLALDRSRLRVLHVMRGSPAAVSGWKTGELICTVDGRGVPADGSPPADTSWPFGKPGRSLSLGMCDGSTRTLVLRRFY
jgi:hypothetical protein